MDIDNTLVDEEVSLRPYSDADHTRTYEWLQDEETRRFTGTMSAPTPDTHLRWLASMRAKDDVELYAVYCEETHVGNAFLAEIDYINRRAYPQLFLGPVGVRGRGLGQRAIKLLLERAFEGLGLHRCYGYPFAYNSASIHMLMGVGYQVEGVMKDHRWMNGAYHDVTVLGILSSDR